MGAPLYDITIYIHGEIIKDAPEDISFRREANYISDFYHDGLNGYKPPKTGRICIYLSSKKCYEKPSYFGSICSYDNVIDELKYLSLSKKEKYKYFLNILHETILEIATMNNWDKEVFNNSYERIIKSDFEFEKTYPKKKSRDRKTTGQVVLTKTENKSIITVLISNDRETKKIPFVEKRNWFWYDSIYNLAKLCKWEDRSRFGVFIEDKNYYYSVVEDKIYGELVFGENDF